MNEGPSKLRANRAVSMWQHKPWWCQPWTIVLSGVVVIATSWLLLQRWWITGSVAVVIALWWTVFLVLVPASYREQAENSDP